MNRRVKFLAVVLLGVGACNDATRTVSQDWLHRNDGAYYAKIALESESSDRRREAVHQLAKTNDVTKQWSYEALDAIARTDRNESVRCAAVRAFQEFGDERPIATLMALLNPQANAERVRPVSPRLRWECISALDELGDRGCVSDEAAPAVVDALIAALRPNEDRNVRIAAATALGDYCDRPALNALIAGLRTEDFGIAHACEESLVRLTGHTNGYRADKWKDWVASVEDPFAEAGQTPTELLRPQRNLWERTKMAVEGAALTWQGESAGAQ